MVHRLRDMKKVQFRVHSDVGRPVNPDSYYAGIEVLFPWANRSRKEKASRRSAAPQLRAPAKITEKKEARKSLTNFEDIFVVALVAAVVAWDILRKRR
jgi:hypothetical protein